MPHPLPHGGEVELTLTRRDCTSLCRFIRAAQDDGFYIGPGEYGLVRYLAANALDPVEEMRLMEQYISDTHYA